MDYKETIEFLFEKLPMFSHIGAAAFKKDLTNTIALCEALGNPHQKFKTIHVAGTNGKGSTSHLLAAILQKGRHKTGLYTSPHLTDFRERIKVDGVWCDEQFVIDFTMKVRPLIETICPSFFEITVAMAFEYFAQQKVDIAVIEVGLGGRLDSTNITTPILSVITNIGWDHTNMLGNTLEAIAGEKAGIIKQGVPVVIGEYVDQTKPVFIQKAIAEQAPIFFAQEIRQVVNFSISIEELVVEVVETNNDQHSKYHLDQTGIYQIQNLLTVLEAANQLHKQGFNISIDVVKEALTYSKKINILHGRWEIIHRHPYIIIDVAHNVDGMKKLINQLEITNFEHLHIIIGMAKDKDFATILELLPKYARYYFTKAQIPRALDETVLEQVAATSQLIGKSYSNVNLAIQAAVNRAEKNDLILVCGSVFIVGEVNINLIHF